MNPKYDLEERLLCFAAGIVELSGVLPKTRAGIHVADQILRSGTSPYPNHGEAQAAESAKDFVHKMSICLKELRETMRWLNLIQKTGLVQDLSVLKELRQENDELIRIFVKSIQTARSNS